MLIDNTSYNGSTMRYTITSMANLEGMVAVMKVTMAMEMRWEMVAARVCGEV